MTNIKDFETFSDAAIIKRIVDGDKTLFELLIRRNNACLYKTGRSYGYNHHDTQDLMQETFIGAYMHLPKFENRSSFTTWILKIMLHNCFHKCRKAGFKNEIPNEITDKSIPMFSSNSKTDANKEIANRELNHIIENSLELVPIDYRMVFSLREIAGLSVAETAEALNISESNVKVRLSRAKLMLRKQIENKYTASEIFEFNAMYCDVMVQRVMEYISKIETK